MALRTDERRTRREITVTNASGPVWTGVMVDSGGSGTNGGSAQPGVLHNPTWDSTWAYRWDRVAHRFR